MSLPPHPADPAAESAPPPSKTRRKKDMHALQDMGAQLVELSPARLATLPIPDELREAVLEAQRIRAHEGRRRQFQYIGKLMRALDAEPIRAALDDIAGTGAAALARHHHLERLRARLMEDEAVLGEIARDHPGADLARLRALRRNALKEAELAKPPRAFRELFRVLRELQGETGKSGDTSA